MMRCVAIVSVLLMLSGCYAVDGTKSAQQVLKEGVVHTITNGWITGLRPALVNGSDAASSRLSVAFETLMGHYVPLINTAFTNKNRVLLERQAQDPIGQQGLNGSLMAENESRLEITLMTDGQYCYLINSQAKRAVYVADLACKAQ